VFGLSIDHQLPKNLNSLKSGKKCNIQTVFGQSGLQQQSIKNLKGKVLKCQASAYFN
jgi:hypothetical protein